MARNVWRGRKISLEIFANQNSGFEPDSKIHKSFVQEENAQEYL